MTDLHPELRALVEQHFGDQRRETERKKRNSELAGESSSAPLDQGYCAEWRQLESQGLDGFTHEHSRQVVGLTEADVQTADTH